jgi:cytochrome c
MNDRMNTIFGWVLFSGIIALGLSSISSKVFHGDKPERPEQLGYVIEGVEEAGGAAGPTVMELLPTADLAAGEATFAKCIACHTIASGGATGIGPNLFGVVGTGIGSHAPGFAYSDALKSKGGEWSFEALDAWLKSPRAFADGTKMSFPGLSSAEDRANVIAYMNAQGSNLPMPAAAAPAAEGEAAAAEAAAAE